MIYFFIRSSTLTQKTNPLFYRMHYSPQTDITKNFALHGIVNVLTLSTHDVLFYVYDAKNNAETILSGNKPNQNKTNK